MAVTLDPLAFPCDFELLGIPHFWNVVTNVPFVVLGIVGLLRMRSLARHDRFGGAGWFSFWLSTALLGLASGWYHLELTRLSLVVDRVFVSAMAATIAYRAALAAEVPMPRWGVLALFLSFAEATVLAWWLGATSIIYGLVQAAFAVYVLVAYVRLSRRAGPGFSVKPLAGMVGFYALAKCAEVVDQPVCDATGCIGGHPFKHLLAAAGGFLLLRFMPTEIAAVKRSER